MGWATRSCIATVSAADLLLDHRVRPDRAVCAAAWLRLADPGDGRRDEPDRRAGRTAAEGRRAGRRSVRRPVWLHRHPRRAAPSRRDGAGTADRHRHAGYARGVAGEPGDELPGDRREPCAARQPASEHRAVPGVPDGGWPHRAVDRQRPDVQAVLRGVRADASAGGCALRHQRGAGGEPPVGDRHADAGDAGGNQPAGGWTGWRR